VVSRGSQRPNRDYHAEYERRKELAAERIELYKLEKFGNSPKFNLERSRKAITHHSNGKPRGQKELARIANEITDTGEYDVELDDSDSPLHYH
jgi:hypothetical protein